MTTATATATAPVTFLDHPPRFVFFTGKGGVGKTSVACATAVHLAQAGRSVLLVSTDPASNVGQVFGVPIGNQITPIADVPGLSALEIDPEQAATIYRERIIGPVRGPALPLYRGGRGLPEVRQGRRRVPSGVRGDRHRPHRAHPAAPRCRRVLPP